MLAVKVWPVLRSVWSRAAGVLFVDGADVAPGPADMVQH